MAVRIVCSACSCVMNVDDELRGKRVRCKCCGEAVLVQEILTAEVVEFAETRRLPPAPPAPVKRRVVDDDDERDAPRRRRREETSGTSFLPLWIAGGAVAVLVIVVVLILALRSGPEPVPVVNNNVNNNNPPGAQDQQPAQVQQAVNAPAVKPAPEPEKRNAPALIPDPPAGQSMKGEEIYQRLLQSTVWIVASHKVVAMNNNQPFAQGIDIPRPPKLPKPNFPRPPIVRPPGFDEPPGNFLPPANQTSNLRGSVWSGNETLPGFGKLTFRFLSNVSVIMEDVEGNTSGSFIHTGNNVTLTFGGGVVYNGAINGNSMGGNATNGKTNWTWNVGRTGGGAGPAPANPIGGGIVAKATGSGSLIDKKHRLVITNVHVVGNADTVTVHFPDFDAKGELIVHSDAYKQKPGITGRVVMREQRADLALVQLERLVEGVQPLNLAKSKAKPAQEVHSVGNPGASKGLWIYSPGKIRQVFPDTWKIFDDLTGRDITYNAMKIETNSPINPGDSGGPLVDDRAALVGVAHGGSRVANNFSFFIEASEVRQIVDRYYKSINEAPPP